MIPNIGPLEIAIVLIIALIVFGPKRLPELGKSLGRGINEFREGVSKIGDDNKDDDEDYEDNDELDTEPAALNPPGEDPEITEITKEKPGKEAVEAKPVEEAEPVESEVVPERQD